MWKEKTNPALILKIERKDPFLIEYISHSTKETEAFAASLAPRLHAGDILACRGGMGMGKTAFARGLAQGLGLRDQVSSPTFALIQEYTDGNIPLYHFDMYRISGLEELYSTGFFDYLDGDGILYIEWSENIQDALPWEHLTLNIQRIDEDSRYITLEGGGRF